jgi:hypothetical protein
MRRSFGATLVALLVIGLAPAGLARSIQPRLDAGARGRPEVTVTDRDALSRSLRAGRLSPARYALERARSLFDLASVRSRYGDVKRVAPRDATYILRDLALHRSALRGEDRAAADRILARPTDPSEGEVDYGSATTLSECLELFCVHWATSGQHAPPLTDSSGNAVPDWVDSVIAELDYILSSYTEMGYQAVKSDLASPENGGDGKPDIYLADVGADSLYGYCTTDDPNTELYPNSYNGLDFSAYCVIDEDFAANQFPAHTPTENMQVTAAHEYFHAVQFGYDAGDDTWFLESTAAWVEDVLYDDINDNYQYLSQSAITYPDFSIDYTDNGEYSGLRYGQWLFFRYLTERFGDGTNHDIDFVRSLWERSAYRDAHPEDVDDYSVLAIENELASRGHDFTEVFADFSMLNWVIELAYEEGIEYFQFFLDNNTSPRPYSLGDFNIKKTRPKTGNLSYDSVHLSAANSTFKPAKGVTSNAKLLLKVDGPGAAVSPVARYVVFYKSGLPDFGEIPLDAQGVGKKKVPFGKGTVAYVALVLVNGSTRYTDCGSGYVYACGGLPLDDDARFVWSGTLKQ